MNGPIPDLLQVFLLNLMNSEEIGTETWVELLGTHEAYFLVDFNLTYESNLDRHSVTHLSLRCSVKGPIFFLVLLSKLHVLFLFFKKCKRLIQKRVWLQSSTERLALVEEWRNMWLANTVLNFKVSLLVVIQSIIQYVGWTKQPWYQMILDEQQRGQGIDKMDFMKTGMLTSF